MNHILLIDGSPLLKEFLKDKLISEQINVESANGRRDAYTKIITIIPNLIIIEINDNMEDIEELLQKKMKDPNAKKIPVIMTGPAIEHQKSAKLLQYGVVKYFTKPIKFDVFLSAVGKLLKQTLHMDDTPCVLDIHNNGNIIFVELSRGLNREKIGILKYKIPELIDKSELRDPKVVLMMSGMTLSYVDGVNLELLFENIQADERIQQKNIKVLSNDEFTKELLDGHTELSGIEITTNLVDVLNSLVDTSPSSDVTEVIATQVLDSNGKSEEGDVETRFNSDLGKGLDENAGAMMKVAVVDDDEVVTKLLQGAFNAISAECSVYSTGISFLKAAKVQDFDVVILDLYIPDMNGFDILKTLQKNEYETPIIIYSQATQKEVVIQVLTLGAKSYVVKPQKPEVLVQKAIELLHS